MRARKTRRRTVVTTIGVAAAALAVGALVYTALQIGKAPVANAGDYAGYVEATESAEVITPKVQLVDVLARLRDTGRPFNIVTLSDSTAAGRYTWIAKTGE